MPELDDARHARPLFVTVENGTTARPRAAAEIEELLARGWATGCDEPTLPTSWQLYLLDARAIMRPVVIGQPALHHAGGTCVPAIAVYPVVDLIRGTPLAMSLSHPALASAPPPPAGRCPSPRSCATRDHDGVHDQVHRSVREGE